ncbi:uncharacterized protein LOC144904350 [Branchiostoma floridae x Branchiostoma belcheri]
MSRPRKSGKWLSDLHDFCRFCGSNQRINGTLQRIRPIFQPGRGGQTIANVLHSLGVEVSEDDKTRSHRMCDKCHRHLQKVLENLKLVEKWKQNELCEPAKPQTPTSAKKRCRESPSKTPRDSKKRLLRTPKSQKSGSKDTAVRAREKITAPANLAAPLSKTASKEPVQKTQETVCRGENRTLANIPDRHSTTTVTVTYPSRVHSHLCDNSLAGVVENIAKGKLETGARLIMAHPVLSTEIQHQLEAKLQKEVSSLLSLGSGPSILRKTTPEDLQEFSYVDMERDLKARAPILHSVLSTVGDHSTVHTCVAASVIIRAKEPRMSALAYIINAILQHGGVKRSALDRLCKMGITTSHKHAIKKQTEMSLHYDQPVKLWRREIELYEVTAAVNPGDSPAVLPPTPSLAGLNPTPTAVNPGDSQAVLTPTSSLAGLSPTPTAVNPGDSPAFLPPTPSLAGLNPTPTAVNPGDSPAFLPPTPSLAGLNPTPTAVNPGDSPAFLPPTPSLAGLNPTPTAVNPGDSPAFLPPTPSLAGLNPTPTAVNPGDSPAFLPPTSSLAGLNPTPTAVNPGDSQAVLTPTSSLAGLNPTAVNPGDSPAFLPPTSSLAGLNPTPTAVNPGDSPAFLPPTSSLAGLNPTPTAVNPGDSQAVLTPTSSLAGLSPTPTAVNPGDSPAFLPPTSSLAGLNPTPTAVNPGDSPAFLPPTSSLAGLNPTPTAVNPGDSQAVLTPTSSLAGLSPPPPL